MNNFVVLVVEDDAKKIADWSAAIRTHNADRAKHGFSVSMSSCASAVEARRLLTEVKFDLAVIDLGLKQSDDYHEPNDDGNGLIKYVVQHHPIGIAVNTGQASDYEAGQATQIEVFDKAYGLDPLLEWVGRQAPLVLAIRAARERFETEMALVFFRSVWPRWKNWTAIPEEKLAQMNGALARHLIAHVHDVLSNDGGDAHPEEHYFVPPLKGRLDTGDLFSDGGFTWIVVTPRCDLAHASKTSTLLAVKCLNQQEKWNSYVGAALKNRGQMVQHDKSPKKHFLAPMVDSAGNSQGPWFAMFDDLKVYSAELDRDRITALRFASLAPQFIPSLVERFGAYFSRIGTPELNSN